MINVVLYKPEIPGNTGNIGRTSLALGFRLILIKPYGFDLSEKSVRRAGLDYWKYVDLVEYDSFADFLSTETPQERQLYFFSKFGKKLINKERKYSEKVFLIYGQETKGLPPEISEKYNNSLYQIPINQDKVRSLNLSNAVAISSFWVKSHQDQN